MGCFAIIEMKVIGQEPIVGKKVGMEIVYKM